ncbi:MAG: hypothetical protein IH964_06295 [Candidatus Dadabacteria bacterium]|nr:hypothetical protein [Candidatus Dadabacteria bacterium]MCH7950758.1 hypothetical protein [Candidatus Dadabacteria bacterium]
MVNFRKINPTSIKSYFSKIVNMSFFDLGKERDDKGAMYLTDMLTEFARTEKLYKLTDSDGRKVQTIVGMLIENQKNTSENTERELRKYVGDFSLFMSGMFREYVDKNSYLSYYVNEGMKSYFVVSRLDLEMGKGDPVIFSKLSRDFKFYSGALNYMRKVYFKSNKINDTSLNFVHVLSRIKH